MEDQMTYEDVVHNWGLVEQYLIESRFDDPESRTYDHLLARVAKWLFSTPVKTNLPAPLSEIFSLNAGVITQLLSDRHVIPSSPILTYAGKEVTGSTNYFSYYNVESLDTFLMVAGNSTFGTEIGCQPLLSEETDERIKSSFVDYVRPEVSFTVREDGSLFSTFMNTKGDTAQRNFVYYHEVRDLDNIVRALNQGKYFGLTFAQNVKNTSIIAHALNPYYSTSKPGYMGPNDTACPMFYINAAKIMSDSESYEEYLSVANKAAFYATILANIVLLQTEGYVVQSVIKPTLKHRPVGVGVMGLHSAMIRCDVPYDSETGIIFASQTQSCITLGTMAASCRLMMQFSKAERVGQNGQELGKIIKRCKSALEGVEVTLEQLNSINESLSTHGCMYNLTSTVQGYDPNLAGLLGVSTEGIDPLYQIEMTKFLEEGQQITLFPLEIYDARHQMTCNLHELKEQTQPYISPKYKLKMIKAIQELSHSPVASDIIFPADANNHAIVSLVDDAVLTDIHHIKMFKGNYSILKRSYTKEIPPEVVQEPETIEVNGESYSLPEVTPSLFGLGPLEDGDKTHVEPSIEVADAKVYMITSPNLKLHVTITDDGKYVMLDAPSNGHATSFSISEALSQFTLSGRTNDGKNTTGD